MGAQSLHVMAKTVQTVGATTADIVVFDLSDSAGNGTGKTFDNVGVLARGRLTGRDTVSGDTVTAELTSQFRRVAGTLTRVSVPVFTVALAGDASIVAAVGLLVQSGTAIKLQATGVLAQTIEWFGRLEIDLN